nr:hypothetical protein [Lachnospiraceae bacterium]
MVVDTGFVASKKEPENRFLFAGLESGVRTKTWTFIGLRKEPFMYSKQQKTNALELYKQTGSVTETVRILG